MRSVGYRQILDFLQQCDTIHITEDEMRQKTLYATRQLAKRQYTWLRSLQEKHKINTYYSYEHGVEDLRNRFR